jgi:hypothetical protein
MELQDLLKALDRVKGWGIRKNEYLFYPYPVPDCIFNSFSLLRKQPYLLRGSQINLTISQVHVKIIPGAEFHYTISKNITSVLSVP